MKNFTDKIYVTAGSKEKCDENIFIVTNKNYKEEDFEEVLTRENIKVDIILDMVGGDYFKKNLKILIEGNGFPTKVERGDRYSEMKSIDIMK